MDFFSIFWIAIIVISIVTEAFTAQLVSIWFMISGLIAFMVSLFTDSLAWQFIIFLISSAIMILSIRPIIKNILKFKVQETNFGRLIGKNAIVLETINNTIGKGTVNIEGIVWSARSQNGDIIDKGAMVRIDSISGVKLIVHKVCEVNEKE